MAHVVAYEWPMRGPCVAHVRQLWSGTGQPQSGHFDLIKFCSYFGSQLFLSMPWCLTVNVDEERPCTTTHIDFTLVRVPNASSNPCCEKYHHVLTMELLSKTFALIFDVYDLSVFDNKFGLRLFGLRSG